MATTVPSFGPVPPVPKNTVFWSRLTAGLPTPPAISNFQRRLLSAVLTAWRMSPDP